ncbi:glycerophosphodiester phosphodiesterase domain-containing protein 5 isoform X1 [Bufo gargarizans]|uniref:glycerophosphodiester phosphodiesterase domain-containing protein 5 isoform X1 n=2 Tax=Bufo gargarizans TaxID=30331 RepID=UPI001CF57647|nr:glycerophosphodiester phosphodiesterase domain-containing protein 5 isoform X1 [Bufo gargarizans]XP_044140699.1 glycerophosphodiester phosphodiesterase domain-containing protein 5 isoform X1 [Bufo gargarizans]
MVKHQPLQYYEPQLCLSCLTGIYGCRWKRYQRSHDDTTKWELLWFMILTFTFFLTLTWFYFWWEVHNDYNEFNWFLYNRTGQWGDWSIPILVSTAAGFTYITALLILALCHIAVGQQMNLHWLHKGFLAIVLVATVVAMTSIEQMWEEEWEVLLISFQATAPFLHIGALAAITLLSWIIAGQFARSEKAIFQVCLILAYLAVVIALYLVPMTISSPCIMEKDLLGPKPSVIGHRGAPMLAPENTLMSFKKALEHRTSGLQADVTVSYDGIPFIMHDDTLRRTTNIKQVFPELSSHLPAMFNWTDLERLNAGEWFINNDPFWTVSSLSPVDVTEAGNQSVCKLTDLLALVKENNASLLLRIHHLPAGHPQYETYINITVSTILQSGLPQERVIWLSDHERPFVQHLAPDFQQASSIKRDPKFMKDRDITFINLRYTEVNQEDIREYGSQNLTLNTYTVNEPWLFSVLWCAGVESVTSDASHILSKVPFPIWLLAPDEYSLIWITSDIISFTVIIGVFILQNYHIIRWRLGSIRTYNPEQIMLSAAVRRTSRDVRIMKEKLIFSEINNGMDTPEELSLCSESRYDGFSNNAITPSTDSKTTSNQRVDET